MVVNSNWYWDFNDWAVVEAHNAQQSWLYHWRCSFCRTTHVEWDIASYVWHTFLMGYRQLCMAWQLLWVHEYPEPPQSYGTIIYWQPPRSWRWPNQMGRWSSNASIAWHTLASTVLPQPRSAFKCCHQLVENEVWNKSPYKGLLRDDPNLSQAHSSSYPYPLRISPHEAAIFNRSFWAAESTVCVRRFCCPDIFSP